MASAKQGSFQVGDRVWVGPTPNYEDVYDLRCEAHCPADPLSAEDDHHMIILHSIVSIASLRFAFFKISQGRCCHRCRQLDGHFDKRLFRRGDDAALAMFRRQSKEHERSVRLAQHPRSGHSSESGGAHRRGRSAGLHVPEHGAGGREPAQAAEEPADL